MLVWCVGGVRFAVLNCAPILTRGLRCVACSDARDTTDMVDEFFRLIARDDAFELDLLIKCRYKLGRTPDFVDVADSKENSLLHLAAKYGVAGALPTLPTFACGSRRLVYACRTVCLRLCLCPPPPIATRLCAFPGRGSVAH